MVDPGRLSPSKITTYEGCPLSYHLKYVEHVIVPENIRLVFGKEVHYVLEQFHKKNFKTPESFGGFFVWRWFSALEGKFLKGKRKQQSKIKEYKYTQRNRETGELEEKVMSVSDHINLGPWNPENENHCKKAVGIIFGYMGLGRRIAEDFYRRHKSKPEPVAIEKRFGFKKDEVIEIGGHELLGVIDRIDFIEQGGNAGWYITDYKTNKHNPKEDAFTFHRNIQFTLYSYVFRQLFGEVEKAVLFYHLRSGKVLKTHRSQQDYDYLRITLDEVAEDIEHDRFRPFYGFHCNMCDYKGPCEEESKYYGGPSIITREGKIIGAEEFTDWYDVESNLSPDVEERVLEGTY